MSPDSGPGMTAVRSPRATRAASSLTCCRGVDPEVTAADCRDGRLQKMHIPPVASVE